jgi:ADP-heptose:LPS heptosyltransferase
LLREPFKNRPVLEVLNNMSGLGDIVCSLPVMAYAFNHLKNTFPHPQYKIYTRHEDLFCNLFPENLDAIFPYDFYPSSAAYDAASCGWKGGVAFLKYPTTLAIHTVDYLFLTLLDIGSLPINFKNYPQVSPEKLPPVSDFKLPKNYAVISVGNIYPTKNISDLDLLEVSIFLKGIGITPVYLGKNYKPADHLECSVKTELDLSSLGINLIDQTTIMETLAVINKSRVVISPDGGLMHLAGLTNRPIVAWFTIADPQHKLPIRNNLVGWNCFTVVPDENLDCRFCQTKLRVFSNFHSHRCYFDDYKCAPKSSKLIEQIKLALKQR